MRTGMSLPILLFNVTCEKVAEMPDERGLLHLASGIKTGGLPPVAASRYDSTISMPGTGDGISKFIMNQ